MLTDTYYHNADEANVCEDDCEVYAPYIDMLPDESNDEDGSILCFNRNPRSRAGDDEEMDMDMIILNEEIEMNLSLAEIHS